MTYNADIRACDECDIGDNMLAIVRRIMGILYIFCQIFSQEKFLFDNFLKYSLISEYYENMMKKGITLSYAV